MTLTYLGIQLDGVLSTSHVANSFMGTGLMPSPKMVCFSAMTAESADQRKGVRDAAAAAAASNKSLGLLSHVALHRHRQHRHTGLHMVRQAHCRLLRKPRVCIFIVDTSKISFQLPDDFIFA